MNVSSLIKHKTGLLFQPVDASVLGLFRICFGIFALVDYFRLENYFVNDLARQKFFFTYDGFGWVKLLPPDQLLIVFWILKISAVFFTLGIFFRLSAIIQFLGWTYLFLSEQGHYNNHFYMFCLVHFFFCIVHADRWGAVHFPWKRKKTGEHQTTIPYWQLFIFQLQVFIVYFYGGIAKLNYDWLHGHPMINTLPRKFAGTSNIWTDFLSGETGALFLSYSGLIFDLLIGFMLFSKRWKYLALIPIIIFHLLNHFLWNIGTFPWIMLATTMLFFDPAWPRLLWEKIKKGNRGTNEKKEKKKNFSLKNTLRYFYHPPVKKIFLPAPAYKRSNVLIAGLGIYFLWQFLFPFRHWLYKGDPAWTGEGHFFSWRMMLTSSDDAVRMRVHIPQDNATFYIDFFAYMNRGQLNRVSRNPVSILKFVQHIRGEIKKSSGITDIDIHLEMYKSVNLRKPRLFNDTTLNYALVEYHPLQHASWILPWSHDMDPLRKVDSDAENWEEITRESMD